MKVDIKSIFVGTINDVVFTDEILFDFTKDVMDCLEEELDAEIHDEASVHEIFRQIKITLPFGIHVEKYYDEVKVVAAKSLPKIKRIIKRGE